MSVVITTAFFTGDTRGARNPHLLTVEEVAAILRTHPDCVYRMIRARQLPAVRLGRAVRVVREALDGRTAMHGCAQGNLSASQPHFAPS